MHIRPSFLLVTTMLALSSRPALAQSEPAADAEGAGQIIVTAARPILPAHALPITIDVIDRDNTTQQPAIRGYLVDAVSATTPPLSPTRPNYTGKTPVRAKRRKN